MTSTFSPPKVLRKDKYFEQTGYIPHTAQRVIHYSAGRHKALSNGRRWGKTLLGGKESEVTAFVKNKLGQPQRGWIVGPNYIDCEKEFRVVYDSLKALGVDTVSSKFLRNVDNGNMHIATDWGWDLECRSAAHPESLVGEGLDFVLLAEAGRLRRNTFTEYIRPALSDKRGWSMATGVPEIAADISLLYWGYKRGQDPEKAAWRSWRMPSWTNDIVFPGGRQDPEILEAEEDLTEDEFLRQYGGFFVEKVGRVMAEFDREKHVKKLRYDPQWPLYAAVDWGYTNPLVWLWVQVDVFGNVYVLGEHYKTLMDAEDFAREVLIPHPLTAKCQAFYPDPAEPDDTNIIHKHTKIAARGNTGGELKKRINMIRSALKCKPLHLPYEQRQPTLFMDESCTRLIWEMEEGYRWPEHKSEVKNSAELPMDKDNHGPEALGRFFGGYFGVVGEQTRKARQSKLRIRR